MDVRVLVAEYGYMALVGGVLMEGETPTVIGGVLAQRGMLVLGWAIVACGATAWLSDQTMYWIGRRAGRPWLDRRPALAAPAARMGRWVERRPRGIVFGFRFIYGARTVAPFLIGVSGFPAGRYMVITALACAAWGSIWACVGYVFGEAAERLLGDAGRIAGWALPVAAGLAAVAGTMMWRRRRSVGA